MRKTATLRGDAQFTQQVCGESAQNPRFPPAICASWAGRFQLWEDLEAGTWLRVTAHRWHDKLSGPCSLWAVGREPLAQRGGLVGELTTGLPFLCAFGTPNSICASLPTSLDIADWSRGRNWTHTGPIRGLHTVAGVAIQSLLKVGVASIRRP